MRLTLRSILIVLMLLSGISAAQAGFLIRKNQSPTCVATATNIAITDSKPVSSPFIGNNDHKARPHQQPSGSGWQGIVAFICSMVGLPVLGIIFGAIGMGSHHKNKGLAIAGFVLGILEIIAFLAIFFLILYYMK